MMLKIPTSAIAVMMLIAGWPAMAVADIMSMALPEIIPTSERSESAWERRAPYLEAELEAAGLKLGAPIFIRVFKASRELELYVENADGFELFRTYRICGVSGDVGPKLVEGDEQAPEGFYSVDADWLNPDSRFHLSFNIGYPNAFDRARGRTGSNIMIHGGCASLGCFAMTDWHMEEIYILAEAALRSSQRAFDVHVFPFRMTDEILTANQESRWYLFWRTLKRGHDHFEQHGRPPRVAMHDGLYVFEEPDEQDEFRLVRERTAPGASGGSAAAAGYD